MRALRYVPKMVKALLAGVIAFLGALGTVLVGDVGFGDLTDGQWVMAVSAALVAVGAIWGVPNQE